MITPYTIWRSHMTRTPGRGSGESPRGSGPAAATQEQFISYLIKTLCGPFKIYLGCGDSVWNSLAISETTYPR